VSGFHPRGNDAPISVSKVMSAPSWLAEQGYVEGRRLGLRRDLVSGGTIGILVNLGFVPAKAQAAAPVLKIPGLDMLPRIAIRSRYCNLHPRDFRPSD
jgi:hypothetical protein